MIRTIIIFTALMLSIPAFADRQGGGSWMQPFKKSTRAVYFAGVLNSNEIAVDILSVEGKVKRVVLASGSLTEYQTMALEESLKSDVWVELK